MVHLDGRRGGKGWERVDWQAVDVGKGLERRSSHGDENANLHPPLLFSFIPRALRLACSRKAMRRSSWEAQARNGEMADGLDRSGGFGES